MPQENNTRADERRGHSGANAHEKHTTYGEGKIDVIRGTLREGMLRGDDTVEGIVLHGCGREAMPVPGDTARLTWLSQRRWGRGADGAYFGGLGVRVAPQPIQGHPWPHAGMSVQDGLEGLQKGARCAPGHQRRQHLLKAAFDA